MWKYGRYKCHDKYDQKRELLRTSLDGGRIIANAVGCTADEIVAYVIRLRRETDKKGAAVNG